MPLAVLMRRTAPFAWAITGTIGGLTGAAPPAAGGPRSKPAPHPAPAPKPKPGARPLPVVLLTAPKGTSVVRAGKPLVVKPGMGLKVGDLIRAGRAGGVHLRPGDQGTLRLTAGTAFRVRTCVGERGPAESRTDCRFRLETGTVAVRLRPFTSRSRFLIETPGALTAARGTVYLVRVTRGATDVFVIEGRVAVSTGRAPADPRELTVGPRERVAIRDKLPARAEAIRPEDERRLRELAELAASVDREGEPLLRLVDERMAQSRFSEAETLAERIVRVGWALSSGVRAHTRLYEIGLQRDNVLNPVLTVPTLADHLLALTGPPLRWNDPISVERLSAVESRVGGIVKSDPLSERFIRSTLLSFRIWRAGLGYPEMIRRCEEAAAAGGDPKIAAWHRAAVHLLRWSQGASIERVDRSAAVVLFRQAYDRMTDIIRDPEATSDTRLQAYLILAHRHGRLPEAALDYAPRLRHAEEMLRLARATRWARRTDMEALALAALRRADEAARLYPASVRELRLLGHPADPVLSAGIAQAYADSDKPEKAAYWREEWRRVIGRSSSR